jgi:predicted RNA-binding Zn ribbon-like protein
MPFRVSDTLGLTRLLLMCQIAVVALGMPHFAPLTGEPLALDLINTRPQTPYGPVDLIATAADLESWLELESELHPGLYQAAAGGLSAQQVAAVHVVRDCAAVAMARIRAGGAPPASALRALNRALASAPPVRKISMADGRVVSTVHRSGTAGARLGALLAEAVADLLTDPAINEVRQCAAQDCVLLFMPGHPRRQWCSATRCGNRARVARHYDRHKHERA